MNKRLVLSLVAVMGLAASGCSVKASAGLKAEPPPEPAPAPEPPPKPKAPVKAKELSHVKIAGDHLEIDQKIHFATDSDVIESDSFGLLDEIAGVLKEHKEIKTIHVVGHTDATGSAAHNKDLSKRRAASVEKALKDRGVSQSIDSRGAGQDELVCKDSTDECHDKNRRVEFKIEKE
jgi:outer membrane protein OmpA-like peptidoglycan-associated protein